MSMGIYIKGMEMPTDCAMLLKIFPDGRVGVPIHLNWTGTMMVNDAEAVPVLPHGRLIDADALTVKLQRHREYHLDGSKSGAAISNGIGQCLDIINGKECPTIIPAEEGE